MNTLRQIIFYRYKNYNGIGILQEIIDLPIQSYEAFGIHNLAWIGGHSIEETYLVNLETREYYGTWLGIAAGKCEEIETLH